MPVGICIKCERPVPDSFHDFEEACECKNYREVAKKEGWKLKFPPNYKYKEGLV